MTLQFDANDYAVQSFAEGIADAIEAAGDPYSKAQAATFGYIKAYVALSEIAWVQNHANWPQGTKDAISVLIIANTFAGFPVPTSIPMTFQAGWDAVTGVPDQFGGGTKEEFWAELAERFPDLFVLDGNELTEPDFISSPPTQADYSDLDQPLARPEIPDPSSEPREKFDDSQTVASPLIVDLDSDGIELTAFNAATTTTFFDIDGDGYAEQTAWVSADDGLLVRDIDQSGTIDDVTELFGSPTIDGFALLAEMDSNGDLFIDANDDDWGALRIWQDANGDAVSQSGELLTLSSLNIVSISLLDVDDSTSTINGNPISHTSTFKYGNGSTDAIVDAWFVHDNMNTYYTGAYTLDSDTLFLPTLRGFGNLPDLHVAMSLDSDLLDLVEDFGIAWDFDSFADPSALDGDIEDILYKWAGVEIISPSSRGAYIDARHLEFLEQYFGDDYLQSGIIADPGPNPASMIEEAYEMVLANIKAQLAVQAGAGTLFDGTITYNPFTGTFEGDLDLSEGAINDLVDYATDVGVDTEGYWLEIADFLEHTKGLANITATEEGWLDTAIYNSGLTTQDWDGIADLYDPDTTGSTTTGDSSNETIDGTSLDDTLTGGGGADTINGNYGDDTIRSHSSADSAGDTLNGGYGNDVIEGNNGNDVIDGGNGNDTIKGGAGNDQISAGAGGDTAEGNTGDDSYNYTSGDDVYYDNGSGSDNDTIYLPSGITSNDLSFYRLGNNDLLIEVGSLGSIQIVNQLNISNMYAHIEAIEFDDTSTLDLSTIDAPDTHGTDGDDNIDGMRYGITDDDDVIYGHGGDDLIIGYGGDDWIDGGAGNDEIRLTYSTSGDTNTILASAGYDVIKAAASTDILLIPDEYSDADVHLYRKIGNLYGLEIHIDGLGQVFVDGQFYMNGIEQIQFEDQSPTITLSSVELTTYGSSGNDNLTAISSGASSNNILYGLEGDDQITGNSTGHDKLYGGEGSDYISGSGGNDEIHGGDGLDYIHGNTGDDTAYGDDGNDQLWGEQGDDILYGGDGNDTLYGGINYSHGGYVGDDELYGGAGDDYLYAENGTNILDGGAGDDTLKGGDNSDTYYYSAGLDSIEDSWGTDLLHVSGGVTINDLSFSNVSTYDTKVTINATTDELTVKYQRHPTTGLRIETIEFDDGFSADFAIYQSWLNGTSGNDIIAGNGNDNVLIGFAGNDDIDAGAGADRAHGGAGADTINGDGGNDLLHGGAGGDTLYGDAGNDILYGGDGLDTLYGGGGDDTFVFMDDSAFNDVDVVKDFDITTDEDVLDIADILSNNGYENGVDTLTDWVEITTSGSDSEVRIDVTGSASFGAGTQIATLEGITGLTDEAALVTSGNLVVV
ncbi:MAG: calcium-binding protein [Candidatus Thiodiazotropha endolucinida]